MPNIWQTWASATFGCHLLLRPPTKMTLVTASTTSLTLGSSTKKELFAPNMASKKSISMLSANSKKLVLYLWLTLYLIIRRQRINLRPSKLSKLTLRIVLKRSVNLLKSKVGHTSLLTDAIRPTTILNGTGTTLTELTSMPNVIKVASILSKVTTKVGQTTTWLTMRMVTLTTLCMLT